MRIEKACSPWTAAPPDVPIDDIPVGTIFRHGSYDYGPYLRTSEGYLDLNTNEYYYSEKHKTFSRYLPLPGAYLVTGEK